MNAKLDSTAQTLLASLVSLEGKVALVTGGSGGIGSAVVRLFEDAGARVLITDRPDRPSPNGAEFRPCDFSDPTAITRLIEGIAENPGRLDIVVHAAGVTRDAVLWKMEPADWAEVMRINLDSAFYVLRSVAPLLRKRGGVVVLISSINAERGKFGQANYAASKAGLNALAKTAAQELGRFGVRVNVIAPGFIETPMTEKLPEAVTKRALEETVLGHLGCPEDVAHAALFLCSGLSAHVTGQILRVDGGQFMA